MPLTLDATVPTADTPSLLEYHMLAFKRIPVVLISFVAIAMSVAPASAQLVSKAFTYQGRALLDGQPVASGASMVFVLLDEDDTVIGQVSHPSVPIDESGVFNVLLDFGSGVAWDGTERSVIAAINGTSLPPQSIRPTPFAMAMPGFWTTSSTSAHVGDGFSNVLLGDGTTRTDVTVSNGGLHIPSGGLCVDSDGFCSAIPGGIRVGVGGIVGANSSDNHLLLVPDSSGNVGIGTAAPVARLDVDAPSFSVAALRSSSTLGTWVRMINSSSGGQQWAIISTGSGNGEGAGKLVFSNQSTGISALTLEPDGNLGIGVTNPTEKLDINGAIRLRGADIVEGFSSSDGPIEPGTVVSIDPTPGNEGRLMPSAAAYDSRVAGVVSGAAGVPYGMSLAVDGRLDGDTKVAMTGRVYVKCSAEGGAIRPGDLLTTASIEGHAMKSSDPTRANGTIIGKAMSSLDADTGLVLVLVNLQ